MTVSKFQYVALINDEIVGVFESLFQAKKGVKELSDAHGDGDVEWHQDDGFSGRWYGIPDSGEGYTITRVRLNQVAPHMLVNHSIG